MRIPKTTGWGIGLAVLTALISGVAVYLNGRFVKTFEDPTLLAAVRNGLVGLVLVAMVAGSTSRAAIGRVRGRDLLGLVLIGVIGGGIPFALFFNGLAQSTSPAAAIIHKTLFLWVALLAVPLLGERLGWGQLAALGLLLAGTLVLAPAGALGSGVGEAMIVGATLLWAVEVVLVKRLLERGVPMGVAVTARMTIGSLSLFAVVAAGGGLDGIRAYGPAHWAAIAVTGVTLLGYVTTWYAALERAPAVTVTSVLVLGAVVTAALQAVATGTPPAASALGGNLLLVVGTLAAMTAARSVLGGRTRRAVAA